MKKLLLLILAALAAGSESQAQCSSNCTDCSRPVTKTDSTSMNKNKTVKPLSCRLTSPELRKRKDEVIARLKEQVLEKKELNNGYAYRFDGTDELLDSLMSFVKSERACCAFFGFSISVTDEQIAWLEITGPAGAKEFIKTELEM